MKRGAGRARGDDWNSPQRLRTRLSVLFAPYAHLDADERAELGQAFALGVLEYRRAHGGRPPRALGPILDTAVKQLRRAARTQGQSVFRGPAVWPVDLVDLAAEEERPRLVAEALATLPQQRQRTVLTRRFGLERAEPQTLEQVARDFGVTRERIRQHEGKALRLLRHPSRAKLLKDLIETGAEAEPARAQLPSVREAATAAGARAVRAPTTAAEPAQAPPPPMPVSRPTVDREMRRCEVRLLAQEGERRAAIERARAFARQERAAVAPDPHATPAGWWLAHLDRNL